MKIERKAIEGHNQAIAEAELKELKDATPMTRGEVMCRREIQSLKGEISKLQAENEKLKQQPGPTERRFPLLSDKGNIGSIPWWVAEQAYMVYADKYGDEQSLERLAERGGFGIEEMNEFYPEWKVKCDIINSQETQVEQLQAKNKELREVIEAALRISDLWTLKEVETMFEDEAKATEAMKTRFEQALKEK